MGSSLIVAKRTLINIIEIKRITKDIQTSVVIDKTYLESLEKLCNEVRETLTIHREEIDKHTVEIALINQKKK